MNSNDLLGTVFPILIFFLAFWFLVIRPARKRQQDMSRIQNSVSVGSEVMLSSGIFGTVVSLGDDTVTLQVAPDTEIKVARQAVARVIDGHTGVETPDLPTDEPEHP